VQIDRNKVDEKKVGDGKELATRYEYRGYRMNHV
jgi:hypothetical protein